MMIEKTIWDLFNQYGLSHYMRIRKGKENTLLENNIILQVWQRSQSKSKAKEKKDSRGIHSSSLGNGNLKNMRETSSHDLMKETIHNVLGKWDKQHSQCKAETGENT